MEKWYHINSRELVQEVFKPKDRKGSNYDRLVESFVWKEIK